jgi:hypothetical protein
MKSEDPLMQNRTICHSITAFRYSIIARDNSPFKSKFFTNPLHYIQFLIHMIEFTNNSRKRHNDHADDQRLLPAMRSKGLIIHLAFRNYILVMNERDDKFLIFDF